MRFRSSANGRRTGATRRGKKKLAAHKCGEPRWNVWLDETSVRVHEPLHRGKRLLHVFLGRYAADRRSDLTV